MSRISKLAVGSMLIVGIGATGAHADGTPRPNSMVLGGAGTWYTQAYENTPTGAYTVPEQSDVTGPQRAPFGTGSHKMTVGQFEVQTELYRTNSYDGVELSDLTRLEYSTFARSTAGGADRQPAYLRLSVDSDGAAYGLVNNASLFFYPANNGTVVNGQWQNWDVDSGRINVDGDTGIAGSITLAEYVTANPDAVLVNQPYVDGQGTHDAGAVSLLAGASNTQTRGEYFVDRVIVGEANQDTLFDFGPNAESDGGTTDVTVTAGNLQGWASQAYDDVNYLNSNQQFVAGPSTPPLGGGSLRMSLSAADNEERVELFRTEQYDGTLVRDLRTLSYATYSRANAGNTTPQQPAYLRLSVDNDGNGSTDATLFFYPANNGVPAQSTWQTWNAGSGDWTSANDPAVEFTLAQYVVAHPDARIVKNEDGSVPSQVDGGVAFIVGGAGLATQMNGEYYLDAINISKVDAATGSVNAGKRFDLEPAEPTVSIGDAQVSEGNTGTTALSFPVTVANPTAQDVTVQYATSNGTATAGSDYTATSGTLTIAAGQTTGTITVPVLSDTVNEATETLTVTLTSPGYGTLADGTATGTIIDNDPAVVPGEPTVSIADASVAEGNNGAILSFPVTVANPTAESVTVHYVTSNGTAVAGSDYAASEGNLTIPAGETTGKIDVLVLSDTVNESTETMTVTLTAPGYGNVGDGTATGTITDNDPVATPPVVVPPVVVPPVAEDSRIIPDLVVKGSGHLAENDDILAKAIRKAAGATVTLYRKNNNGKFRKIASAVLNAKGNFKFVDITDRNGIELTKYKVKISSTELTFAAKARKFVR